MRQGSFYKELFKVKNRNGLQPWQAAQAVQRSAYSDGSNYKANWALGQQVAGKRQLWRRLIQC
jgi:hypothetical protein